MFVITERVNYQQTKKVLVLVSVQMRTVRNPKNTAYLLNNDRIPERHAFGKK